MKYPAILCFWAMTFRESSFITSKRHIVVFSVLTFVKAEPSSPWSFLKVSSDKGQHSGNYDEEEFMRAKSSSPPCHTHLLQVPFTNTQTGQGSLKSGQYLLKIECQGRNNAYSPDISSAHSSYRFFPWNLGRLGSLTVFLLISVWSTGPPIFIETSPLISLASPVLFSFYQGISESEVEGFAEGHGDFPYQSWIWGVCDSSSSNRKWNCFFISISKIAATLKTKRYQETSVFL